MGNLISQLRFFNTFLKLPNQHVSNDIGAGVKIMEQTTNSKQWYMLFYLCKHSSRISQHSNLHEKATSNLTSGHGSWVSLNNDSWSCFFWVLFLIHLTWRLWRKTAYQLKTIFFTLPSAPCSFPQAAMTNTSLTERHATSSMPFFFKSAAWLTKPGRCVWKHQRKVNWCKDHCI